jgi:hypothetical protein
VGVLLAVASVRVGCGDVNEGEWEMKKKPVKRKPREWWGLIQYGDKGSVLTFRTRASATRIMKDWNERYGRTWTLIHLREVLK